MSTAPSTIAEYEFDDSQNQLIGGLARKMGLVGFVMLFFGLLQIVHGVTTLVASRNPDRVIAAAEKAGMPAEQLSMLKEALAGGFWASPLTVSSLAFAMAGLFLFLLGLWTRKAAMSFAGIVQTKGRDVERLMDALGAMHRKYSLMYTVLLVAALVSIVSLGLALWQSRAGG
jgi:hypothetical protein